MLAIGALCSGVSDGGDFSFSITAKTVQVIKDLGVINTTLEELFNAWAIINPLVFKKAVKRGFGGERDDQEFKKFKTGSLLVPLHCFTDERFLEVLDDFISGRLKERLQEEFLRIGVETQGMEIEIKNVEEVNKISDAIQKRYAYYM